MTLKERLDAFIKYKGISRAAFEKASGLSPAYTRNIKENLGAVKLEGILSAFPDLNRIWLITGEGEMLNFRNENTPDNVKERLVEFLKSQEIPQTRFEKKCGFANGFINSIRRSISAQKVQKIQEEFPELNRDWLLFGEGEMLNDGNKEIAPDNNAASNLVPLISLDARGGLDLDNEEAGEEYVERLIPWDGARAGDIAMPVSGESMGPVIPRGSFVLLRNVPGWFEFLEFGVVYVLELNDYRRLLKKVVRSDEEGCLRLESYNPEYEPQDIPINSIRRVYKVISHMSNYGY